MTKVFIPAESEIFCSHQVQTSFESNAAYCAAESGDLSLGLDASRREADLPTPSCVEDKNAWRYAPSPRCTFMTWEVNGHRDIFIYLASWYTLPISPPPTFEVMLSTVYTKCRTIHHKGRSDGSSLFYDNITSGKASLKFKGNQIIRIILHLFTSFPLFLSYLYLLPLGAGIAQPV
jgi:hypothetical protein